MYDICNVLTIQLRAWQEQVFLVSWSLVYRITPIYGMNDVKSTHGYVGEATGTSYAFLYIAGQIEGGGQIPCPIKPYLNFARGSQKQSTTPFYVNRSF